MGNQSGVPTKLREPQSSRADLAPPPVDRRLPVTAPPPTVPDAPPANAPVTLARLIAFYLPQYHPIPENDVWWGTGFTEWTNVATARPCFAGHNQPCLPSDLGFYDLRLPETRIRQAELAREYGIHGFCYHYYWFSGRRILQRPLEEVLHSGQPDFPFCICWANEPWSRRWDGSDAEVLIPQEHDLETDKRFIDDVMPLLKDRRYIRVGGCPLLVIYRVSLLDRPKELFAHWRAVAVAEGLRGLHICLAETFGQSNPYEWGCDSAVEFPPHAVAARELQANMPDLAPGFAGKVYSYEDVVSRELARPLPPYLRYRTAMPGWDNTARRGLHGHVFAGATPDLYETWLDGLVRQATARPDRSQRLVFVNAWNEWGEGAHLEPDRAGGHRYLAATRRVLTNQSGWRELLRSLVGTSEAAGGRVAPAARALQRQFERLETVNRFLLRELPQLNAAGAPAIFMPIDLPAGRTMRLTERGNIDRINRFQAISINIVPQTEGLFADGWSLPEDWRPIAEEAVCVTLSSVGGGQDFCAYVSKTVARSDVTEHLRRGGETVADSALLCGFHLDARLDRVPVGEYFLALDRVLPDSIIRFRSGRRLIIV